MEYIASTLNNLIHQTAFFNLTWGNYVMILVACFFLYLAIRSARFCFALLPDSVRYAVGKHLSRYHAAP